MITLTFNHLIIRISKYLLLSILLLSTVFFLSGCKKYEACNSCAGVGKTKCDQCKGVKIYYAASKCSFCIDGVHKCTECNGYAQLECSFCDGDGNSFVTCYGCGGSGLYFYPSGGAYPCNVCWGSGQIFGICHHCNGDGTLYCDNCDGSGRVQCMNCKGTGKLSTEKDCNKCDPNGQINCPNCQGEGKIRL